MIRIETQFKDGKIVNLLIKGHANSAPHGEDLVCAAVSSIAFGGLNALDNPKTFDIIEKEGYLEVVAHSDVTKHDYDVLETILIQLKTVEESNKKYIKIIEKGCR